MRKSKFSESQIVGILKEAESGVPVADLLRQHGISRTTFFKWRSKYAGASVADGETPPRARRREREAETDVCRSGVGERGNQGRLGPKVITPSAKRQVTEVLVGEHQLPVRRACQIVNLSRAAYYRPPVSAHRRDAAVIEPYRVCRRAFSLRGWSHVTTESVFPRSTRASGAAGPRARG